MIRVSTSRAGQVWRGIWQLFEFYLYTVNRYLLDVEQNSKVELHEVRDVV